MTLDNNQTSMLYVKIKLYGMYHYTLCSVYVKEHPS
jgi:hypothetical protein